MATYRIRPCARLSGEITVHSAKNAVLPLMCGALLTRETVTIEQIPALTDVKTLTDILRDCGVLMHADQAEKLLTMTADSPRSPRREDLLSRMRASVLVMGPLLARTGYARVALPGGCAIGQRPIDLHLKGMEALGAHVEQTPGFVTLRGKLRGGFAPVWPRDPAAAGAHAGVSGFSDGHAGADDGACAQSARHVRVP